jgi:hypothetical protein
MSSSLVLFDSNLLLTPSCVLLMSRDFVALAKNRRASQSGLAVAEEAQAMLEECAGIDKLEEIDDSIDPAPVRRWDWNKVSDRRDWTGRERFCWQKISVEVESIDSMGASVTSGPRSGQPQGVARSDVSSWRMEVVKTTVLCTRGIEFPFY